MKFNMDAAQSAYNRMGRYKSRKWQGWLVVVAVTLGAGIGYSVNPEFVVSMITVATIAYQYFQHNVDVAEANGKAAPTINVDELTKTIEALAAEVAKFKESQGK